MRNSPTYQTWADMLNRCRNPNARQFKNYGARGIVVCERWHSFANFHADMGERPAGLTIERKDNDGDYCKENCKWASRAEQRRNQCDCRHIEIDGSRKTVEEWARHVGLAPMTILRRLRRGIGGRDAVLIPAHPGRALSGKKGAARRAAIARLSDG